MEPFIAHPHASFRDETSFSDEYGLHSRSHAASFNSCVVEQTPSSQALQTGSTQHSIAAGLIANLSSRQPPTQNAGGGSRCADAASRRMEGEVLLMELVKG
eukprot:4691109-Prymnesium_polylepis.1